MSALKVWLFIAERDRRIHQLSDEYHSNNRRRLHSENFEDEDLIETVVETPIRYEDLFQNVPRISKFEPPPAYYSNSSLSSSNSGCLV